MWLEGWGFCICWCSDLHITSKWSSKGPFSSPETVLCHIEYLIFGRIMKFGEISILATFSYHFIHKIMYFSVLYLICRFFLRSVGLYWIKIESIWNICFSCMKIYFEEIFWSLFVTNYCIFWIELIRWLWRKRYKNHIITLPVKKLPYHHTNVFISYRYTPYSIANFYIHG